MPESVTYAPQWGELESKNVKRTPFSNSRLVGSCPNPGDGTNSRLTTKMRVVRLRPEPEWHLEERDIQRPASRETMELTIRMMQTHMAVAVVQLHNPSEDIP